MNASIQHHHHPRNLFRFIVGIFGAALVFALLAMATGCAQMGTNQKDKNVTERYELDEVGRTNAFTRETRETSTKASGRALFSASSTFEGLDASQNGSAQGLKVAKSSQKSDLDKLIDAARSLAPLAAALSGAPIIPPAAPSAPVANQPDKPPPGMKWVLAPTDDPSRPQPEIQP